MESSYVSNTTTVTFDATKVYTPACLKVAKGATVTFSGAFSSHPLAASTRGTSGNPIPSTNSGTTKAVAFPAAGFFPYYCTFHGNTAGANMAGVVWVE